MGNVQRRGTTPSSATSPYRGYSKHALDRNMMRISSDRGSGRSGVVSGGSAGGSSATRNNITSYGSVNRNRGKKTTSSTGIDSIGMFDLDAGRRSGGGSSVGSGGISAGGSSGSGARPTNGLGSAPDARIVGTGGASLPGTRKETGSFDSIRPRTLSPAPGVREDVNDLGGAPAGKAGGSGSGLDSGGRRGGGGTAGTGSLGAGLAAGGAVAAGTLGRDARVDALNGKRTSSLDGRDYTHRGGDRYRGESYGGDYYHNPNHYDPYYNPYYCGYQYHPSYGWWFGYGWGCWSVGWGWGLGWGWGWGGCYGWGWSWPYYRCYGYSWPYYYGYYYPFHRVYHYGYSSYCPERVVIYETYYDTEYAGGYAAPAAGDTSEPVAELPPDPLVTGDVMLRAGNYEEAVEAFREAVEAEPDNSVAKFALADALFATGSYHEATYMVRRGLAQDPEWLDASVSKGDIFPSVEEFERLLGKLEAHALERPYDASGWFLLGFQKMYHGQHEAAVSALERAGVVLPGDTLTTSTLEKARARKAAADASAASEAAAGSTAAPERVSATAPPGTSAAVSPATAAPTTEGGSSESKTEGNGTDGGS